MLQVRENKRILASMCSIWKGRSFFIFTLAWKSSLLIWKKNLEKERGSVMFVVVFWPNIWVFIVHQEVPRVWAVQARRTARWSLENGHYLIRNRGRKRHLLMIIWKRILLLVTLLSLCIVEAKRSESGGRSGRKRNRGNKGERRKGGKGRKNRNKQNKTPPSTNPRPSSTGGVKPNPSGSRAIWQGMDDHFGEIMWSVEIRLYWTNLTPCFCIWSFFQKETFLAFFGPTWVAHTHIRADTCRGNILSCF